MPALSGIIEAVSIKPLNQADRFGNTFRASLKVGEDWIGWGGTKKEAINIKDGSGWTQLAKGMQVEFMYDLSKCGNFKNIKKASLAITDKSNAQATPAPSQQASKPQQQSSGGSFVNPAALGNAGNYLMHTLEFTHEDMMDDAKVTEGLVKYHKSREQLSKFWEKAEKLAKESAPEPKRKPKPVEDKPPFDEDIDMGYDDDLPV